jgi:hypothetical protein
MPLALVGYGAMPLYFAAANRELHLLAQAEAAPMSIEKR